MSSKNLFEATLEVATLTGEAWRSVLTGGSTSTAIDTTFLSQADDYWGGGGQGAMGVFWNITNQEFSRVTDFDQGTNTLTVSTTTSNDSGDQYQVSTPRYPLYELIQSINGIVQRYQVPLIDTSTTTVADKREYDTPANVCDVRAIYIATTTTANNKRYRELRNWEQIRTGPAAQDIIEFDSELPSGYTLRIHYVDQPAQMTAASDAVPASIPFNWLCHKAVESILMRRSMRINDTDKGLNNQLGMIRDALQTMGGPTPMPRKPKLIVTQ